MKDEILHVTSIKKKEQVGGQQPTPDPTGPHTRPPPPPTAHRPPPSPPTAHRHHRPPPPSPAHRPPSPPPPPSPAHRPPSPAHQVDISEMTDEEVIKAGREVKKKLNGPSWWRMKMREVMAKRPYDLAMFRFKTTLKAIENFKQKEFNIESMVEQVSEC